MKSIRILVDSFADEGLQNAQMGNAREIVRRLDADQFHVSIFHVGAPDPLIAQRKNTKLVPLPHKRQTIRIVREFVWGAHDILFYLKSSPASRYYMALRKKLRDDRIVIGTMESRADMRNEPTISSDAVRLWEQTILKSDYLFSNSSAVQRSLQKEYGLRSGVIPGGVDTKFFTPGPSRKNNFRNRVLFVGSLRPFKGPHLILEAARKFPQADFALAGEGCMAGELREIVSRDQLNNVQFLGLLNAQELREQYRQSDIFLFPSKWEGSPKVILEAAACGLPVIARQDYEPETVLNGITGYLVTSDAEMFDCLTQLIQDRTLRTTMGNAGWQHSEKFDWDVIAKKWEQVFAELISYRGAHRAA